MFIMKRHRPMSLCLSALQGQPLFIVIVLNSMVFNLIPLNSTLCDPMDCRLLGSSVHEVFQEGGT